MSFDSIDRILESLTKQPGWEAQQRYRHLLQCWESTIDRKIAQHARPLHIARNVLWVATSSSVWAQNLSLMRYSLLKRLNALIDEPLVDIRFSTAQWHDSDRLVDGEPQASDREKHPSEIVIESALSFPEFPPSERTPETAFQRWAAVIEARSQNLPLCPCCQSPTPPGELERWNLCAYCAAKQWSFDRNPTLE